MSIHPTFRLVPSVLAVIALTTACRQAPGLSVSAAPIAAGDECDNGGFTLTFGEDADGDGTISVEEITSTQTICNGADGTDGTAGNAGSDGATGNDGTDGSIALIDAEQVERGDDDCPHGGTVLSVGLDNGDGGGTAGDGILQDGEIDDVTAICDGAPAWDPGLMDAPAGPPGAYTMNLQGGDGSNDDGGDGGEVLLYTSDGGLVGGHLKMFDTGDVDAGFIMPVVAPNLGDMPLEITSDVLIDNSNESNCDGVPDDTTGISAGYAYFGGCNQLLYIWDGSAGQVVTGVHVAAGVTARFRHTNRNYGQIYVDNDVFNEGTMIGLTGEAGYAGLDIYADSYIGAAGSSISMEGDVDEFGGRLNISLDGSFLNEGTFDLIGPAGQNGGDVEVQAEYNIYNTGDIFVDGGMGDTSAGEDQGGDGGEAYLYSSSGHVFNSGDMSATGGDGDGAEGHGGDGGEVSMWGDTGLRNRGDIDTSGGDADASCSSCEGGDPDYNNSIYLVNTDGDLRNSGDLTADGGDGGAGEWGGDGGQIWLYIDPDNINGSMAVSGNMSARGGDGGEGGEGGDVVAVYEVNDNSDGDVAFYGYTQIDMSGGDATDGNGGDGGEAYFDNSCPDTELPTGGVINTVDMISTGGGSAGGETGGYGGGLFMLSCTDSDQLQIGGGVAINRGDIDARGGAGTDDAGGGGGGGFLLGSHTLTVSEGELIGSGGDGSYGGGGGEFYVYADAGQVTITGDIDGSGGNATSGEGGSADFFEAWGTAVDNTATLTFDGGDNAADDPGSAGSLWINSYQGLTANSGDISIVPGAGTTVDGGSGSVIIDGFDRTDDFNP